MRKPPNDAAAVERGTGHPRPRSSRAKSRGAGTESERTPFDFAQDEREGGAGHVPERTCILTRSSDAREHLIRLALAPDGRVLPDVRAKAPGRGAWIGVDREALETARAKGKLKGALARAFKTGEIVIPDDLGQLTEDALAQAALDRLGLEARAGTLITGSEKIDVAARRGQVHLLIHASDAGADGNGKLDQAWRVGGGEGQGLVFPADRAILSLALGRQNVVHVALIDRAAALRVRHAVDRWRAFIGRNVGLGTAAAQATGASAVDVNEGL